VWGMEGEKKAKEKRRGSCTGEIFNTYALHSRRLFLRGCTFCVL